MDSVFNFLDNGFGMVCFLHYVSGGGSFRTRCIKRKLMMDVEMKMDKFILEEIVGLIQQINYGEVVVTIHDSEIVQVEKREKKRFKARKPLHKQS